MPAKRDNHAYFHPLKHMNKTLTLTTALLLAACANSTATFLEGIPPLADGDNEFWMYYCTDGNDKGQELQVDYANMGGEYSATPKLASGKRVLSRQSAYDFSDGEYRWHSDDGGRYFRLSHHDQTEYSHCGARRKLDKDAVYLR